MLPPRTDTYDSKDQIRQIITTGGINEGGEFTKEAPSFQEVEVDPMTLRVEHEVKPG